MFSVIYVGYRVITCGWKPKLYADPEYRSIPGLGFLDATLEWTSIPTRHRDLECCSEGQPLIHQLKGRDSLRDHMYGWHVG